MSPTRKFAGIAPFFGKRVYEVISEELGARRSRSELGRRRRKDGWDL
jgi:hypothetical protein